MKSVSPWLRLLLLGVVCFTLAAILQPRAAQWGERAQSDSMLKMFLGEGRKLFANHFFVEADVTFHSGYYPSIFDQARRNMKQSPMVSGHHDDHDEHSATNHDDHATAATDEHGHDAHDESEHEKEMAFLNEPKDWIERFGRKFIITEHTHLAAGKEREILPWLRISADLDPQRVETYTVAAFWLRGKLGRVVEAEQFLREGLRANPNSPEILFELGRLYAESNHDDAHAKNVWELALRRWQENNSAKKEVEPDQLFLLDQISVNLARVEESAGNYDKAIAYLQLGKTVSPHPEELDKQIEEIKLKKAGQSPR